MRLFKQNVLTKLTGLIILLAVVYGQFSQKQWNDEGAVITADARGYYAYLPAIFIHDDLRLEHPVIPGDYRSVLRPGSRAEFHAEGIADHRCQSWPGTAYLCAAIRGDDHILLLLLYRAGLQRERHGGQFEEVRCICAGHTTGCAYG